jgi:hypothetical protein
MDFRDIGHKDVSFIQQSCLEFQKICCLAPELNLTSIARASCRGVNTNGLSETEIQAYRIVKMDTCKCLE